MIPRESLKKLTQSPLIIRISACSNLYKGGLSVGGRDFGLERAVTRASSAPVQLPVR